jgi:tetratricopeptide (TPR) repeat protein
VKGYTTQDVTRLIGLSAAQVRAFARDGFLTPGRGGRGELLFSFQDLVILRTAKGLVAARIPARRIRTALRRLRDQLPRGRSLAELRITAEAGRIVVQDGSEAWSPESDQIQLDFAVADLATRARPLARRAAAVARRAEQTLDAEDWYELGLELEAVDPVEARDAYRRALELDVHHADARVNLGRLLHEGGLVAEAERHYRLALRDDPDHATAAFNLGIALEDLDRPADAIEAYRLALHGDPHNADAHFNIARLYEKIGKRAAALRHYSAYRRLGGEE